MSELLLTIRAKPNSSRNRVGGSYGGALVVAVTAPAVDGKASAEIIRQLALALGVPKGSLRVKSGERSRTKIVAIELAVPERVAQSQLEARISTLLGESGAP
ncbi:MAG TPA: DUF167 domain-containing protein [Candidatus Nanopelagicaceae bacterium]|nr:DUF167 domain-containing protein [Candidatus Nanopelagicaceae bacterium]